MKWVKAIGWACWFVGIVIFIQNAVASRVELQPRAARISWTIVILMLVPAALVLINRINEKRSSKPDKTSEET